MIIQKLFIIFRTNNFQVSDIINESNKNSINKRKTSASKNFYYKLAKEIPGTKFSKPEMVKYTKEFDCSDRNIKLWMEKVETLENSFKFEEEFIFNFDETSIQLDGKKLKILSSEQMKPIIKKIQL